MCDNDDVQCPPEDVRSQPVVAHDLGYGGPLARLQRQQVGEQLPRAGRVVRGQRRGRAAHDLEDERGQGRRLERALEGTELVQHAAQRPHVRLGVVRLAWEILGSSGMGLNNVKVSFGFNLYLHTYIKKIQHSMIFQIM